MPLVELTSSSRSAGMNSVMRKLARGEVQKIFLAKDADEKITLKVNAAAKEYNVPLEIAADSQQLGRACALTRKTAVAAILREKI